MALAEKGHHVKFYYSIHHWSRNEDGNNPENQIRALLDRNDPEHNGNADEDGYADQ